MESWLAGWLAQDIKGVLKVLVVCNPEERARRIGKRDRISTAAARQINADREEKNTQKWRRMYGQIDFWGEGLYDVVVDTGIYDAKETLAMVLERFNHVA